MTATTSLISVQRSSQSTASDKQEERSDRAEQYRNDTKRSNVHAALHYDFIIVEYGLTSHCNVLIDENKHRYFKKIVYYINHSNFEKTMLLRENTGQTVRLILLDDFAHTEPETTQLVKNIYSNCPSLFDAGSR